MSKPVRKTVLLTVTLASLLSLPAQAVHDQAISDNDLGLSKTSVFDNSTPAVFELRTLDPKESGVLPRYWEGAPPQVPHRIDKFVPLKAKSNKCLECHDEPDKIGKNVKGKSTPMPQTHYLKVDGGELTVSNKYYVCTLCHVPQADVETLVDNTFKKAK